LVFHSSTITMMHGPINIRLTELCLTTLPFPVLTHTTGMAHFQNSNIQGKFYPLASLTERSSICDNVENLWYSQTGHSNNTTLPIGFVSSVNKAKRTLRIYNHYSFSSATMDMGTRILVTFPRTFPLLFSFMLKYDLIV